MRLRAASQRHGRARVCPCSGATASLDFRLTMPSRRAAPPYRRPCPPAGGALPCLEAMLRRGARVVLALLLALAGLLAPALEPSNGAWHLPAAQAQTVRPPSWRETQRDFDVVNGYYFTQTGGSPSYDQGYSITNADGIPLWNEFQRLGGVQALGYPVSRRFTWDGFVVQATQKAVLQWRPDLGRAVFVNVFDELSRAGKDDWLLAY